MASRTKLSGIQRQALALYRGFLRTARLKSPEERHRIESVVSAEFRENARNVDRKNFVYIEYLMRGGKRQLEQLKNPDITGLSTLEINKKMKQEGRAFVGVQGTQKWLPIKAVYAVTFCSCFICLCKSLDEFPDICLPSGYQKCGSCLK